MRVGVMVLMIMLSQVLSNLNAQTLQNHLTQADSFNGLNLFDSSLVHYQRVAKLAIDSSDIDAYTRALIGLGIGLRYNDYNYNYAKALEYFEQASFLLENREDVNEERLAAVYYHISTCDRVLGEYQKAIDFGELALHLMKDKNDTVFIAKTYNTLSNAYGESRLFEKAITYNNKAIALRASCEIPNDPQLPSYYLNKAFNQKDAGFFKESNSTFQSVINLVNVQGKIDTGMTSLCYGYMSLNYCDMGRNEKSLEYYYSKKKLVPPETISSNQVGIEYCANMSFMNNCMGRPDSALYYIQLGLIHGITDFRSLDIEETPSLTAMPLEDQIIAPDVLFLLLEERMAVLYELFTKTNDPVFLKIGNNTMQLLDTILSIQRNEPLDDASQIHLSRHSHSIYEKALNNSFALYQDKPQESILNDAINYMERSKHNILLKNKNVSDQVGWDSEQLGMIRDIQYDLHQLREDIQMSKQRQDDLATKKLMAGVVGLHKSKSGLLAETGVYKGIWHIQDIDIAEIKRMLSPNDLMVSYFWGDDAVFAIALTDTQQWFKKIDKRLIEERVKKYIATFSHTQAILDSSAFESFVMSSHFSYQYLLAPFVDSLFLDVDLNKIIIVPDGILTQVSFAGLLRDDRGVEKYNYSRLNYVVRDFELNYAFSLATLLSDTRKPKTGNSLLGFSNQELYGTQWELNNIADMWDGKKLFYHSQESTESNFKKYCERYNMLHLSSHALSDTSSNEIVMEFYSDSVSSEDGRLHNYEIYPLQLKARLVTLSACESGLGNNVLGEGVYSLARGFSFAGCPTIVMSLWKVGDIQTSYIMTDFYKSLGMKQSVSGSLRLAQLEYLNSRSYSDAHPFYWAGFLTIGDGSQVIETPAFGYRYLMIGFVLICVIFFYRIITAHLTS